MWPLHEILERLQEKLQEAPATQEEQESGDNAPVEHVELQEPVDENRQQSGSANLISVEPLPGETINLPSGQEQRPQAPPELQEWIAKNWRLLPVLFRDTPNIFELTEYIMEEISGTQNDNPTDPRNHPCFTQLPPQHHCDYIRDMVMIAKQQEQDAETKRGSQLMSPQEASMIDVSNIRLDNDKLYQIYVGELPPGTSSQRLSAIFGVCGEIKGVYLHGHPSSQNYAFVNFVTREGAINAFEKRDFEIDGEPLDLAGFHKELTIVLRRIPTAVDHFEFQKTLLDYLSYRGYPEIYAFAEFTSARYGNSVYLHFLSVVESSIAYPLFSDMQFTQFATEKLHLIPDPAQARYITNEEVERRQASGERPNEDLQREILQFLCVRFQDKNAKNETKEQVVIQAKPNDERPRDAQPNSVYLRDLPHQISQEVLMQEMSVFGNVENIIFLNNKQNMGFAPSAIVYFYIPTAANAAVAEGTLRIGNSIAKINPHFRKGRTGGM